MARVHANHAVDMGKLDFHRIVEGALWSKFFDNNPWSIQGVSFRDTYEVHWEYQGGIYSSDILGDRLAGDDLGITGGDVTGYAEFFWDLNDEKWIYHWSVVGFSIRARQITKISQTANTDDDYTLLREIFSGKDTFRLSPEDDIAFGYGGSDKMYGGGGPDILYGGTGGDNLIGGGGRDILDGGRGADRLDGGAGNDTAGYVSAGSGVLVDLSNPERNTGDAKGDTFRSIENLWGTGRGDTLIGDSGANDIHGGSGADEIVGNDGDDRLFGEERADKLFGGSGVDHLFGGKGEDTLHGNQGDDALHGNERADILYGGAGDDDLFGDAGNDVLRGQAGGDRLRGGDGNDQLFGNDSGGDFDLLFGGDGNDTLSGGRGQDTLEGGAGNDLLIAGAGADFLRGGNGDDRLQGDGGDDDLNGGDNNDRLVGGAGMDVLFGDKGDDWLSGSRGDDELWGGTGADTFDFGRFGGTDIIQDFRTGDDIVSLHRDLWDGRPLTVSQVLDTYGSVTGSRTVLAFETATLIIERFTDIAALENDILIA